MTFPILTSIWKDPSRLAMKARTEEDYLVDKCLYAGVRLWESEFWLREEENRLTILHSLWSTYSQGTKMRYRVTRPYPYSTFKFTKTGKLQILSMERERGNPSSVVRDQTYSPSAVKTIPTEPPFEPIRDALRRLFERNGHPGLAMSLQCATHGNDAVIPRIHEHMLGQTVHDFLKNPRYQKYFVFGGFSDYSLMERWDLYCLYRVHRDGLRGACQWLFKNHGKRTRAFLLGCLEGKDDLPLSSVVPGLVFLSRFFSIDEALNDALHSRHVWHFRSFTRTMREVKALKKLVRQGWVTEEGMQNWLRAALFNNRENYMGWHSLTDTIRMLSSCIQHELVVPKPLPGNLRRAHDVVMRLSRKAVDEKTLELLRPEWPDVSKIRLHGLSDGTYTYVLPTTPDELLEWGFEQDHCIFDYGAQFCQKRSLLVGIKLGSKMVACAELRISQRDGTLRVNQMYGPHNTQFVGRKNCTQFLLENSHGFLKHERPPY